MSGGKFLNISFLFFFSRPLKNPDYWNNYIQILYVDHILSLNLFLFKQDCCQTSDVFLETIYYSWVFQIVVASVHGSTGSELDAIAGFWDKHLTPACA